MLSIRLAKREEAKPKQIKVNVGQTSIDGKDGKKDAVSAAKSASTAA